MKKHKTIAWICLIISGLLELVWAYFMKQSSGFTEFWPAVLTVIFLMPSFFLLEKGIREFGIGMSYGVFTGIGIAGTTVIGIIALGESASPMKLISLAVLVCGIVGLKFVEGKEETDDFSETAENAGFDNAAEGPAVCGDSKGGAES